MFNRLCFACGFLVSIAPLSGQGRAPKPVSHSTAVVRPLSLGTDSSALLRAIADTTRAHIVERLKAAGVRVIDRSRPVQISELSTFVAAHFAVLGVVGVTDSQLVMIVRLATTDGDSLSQVRLIGPPSSAAVFGDSLASLFAPTILGQSNAPR